jgi:hypothetical protein
MGYNFSFRQGAFAAKASFVCRKISALAQVFLNYNRSMKAGKALIDYDEQLTLKRTLH